ncbi:alpha-amylase family glycosyl hydrolase [Paenibacillus roseipurpureus]|uniref:Alpha-amylase family glycosyl hydrolase n=1 Tax=Paenibacillus roseopurpureus TaxID=2918901 RepID=A0AA96LWA9_9BACL|nr:alpha-amylase family glycosyl hydrolase [Paenibacillus sp. MBLB1832]WNR45850.1 alpha-amylase family glycosyl hydrolase [Paenibacillus sp. MBLB1832]
MKVISSPRGFSYRALLTALLLMVQLLAGLFPSRVFAADIPVNTGIEQPGGKTQWYLAGIQDWNNQNPETKMKHIVGDYYEFSKDLQAGHYEFKFVKNGTWEGFSDNGGNFAFDLATATNVKFYINEGLNLAKISIPGVHGLEQYVPQKADNQWPRLVGDIQTLFGEPEWSPSQAAQFFVDYNLNGTVYKLQRTIPAGSYKAKVTFSNDWNNNDYGGPEGDLKLVTLDEANVTFSIDYSASNKLLSHDYVAKDSVFDGQIKKDGIVFDSRSITYKKPFGAIKAGNEDLTLRISANKGDVQFAKAELTAPDGLSNAFMMRKATTVEGKDYFEVSIPKSTFAGKIGIWGYKFILVDGSTKVEYGDDGASGATGSTSDEGALPYNLTVYDPNYQTPDWMKNAVVYQIFPDRFFDGNSANNRAKLADGARGALESQYATSKGGQKLQYFDGGVANDPASTQVWGTWGDFPENPDRKTPVNAPYYPDAKTDGAWTNEFYGGDIQGIQQKLGYLKALGVTAVYLNPVSWAASNHKYDATDYKHLDPMFGVPVYNTPNDPASGLDYAKTREASDAAFLTFTKAAKAVGIKVINDGVFNHVGDDSIYFDRYEKYPEIGAYEYWSKVYDRMKATNETKQQAEEAVKLVFTSQINPMTGQHYQYPEDFKYTTWFTVLNEKVKDRDTANLHYKYDAWWGYDSLPVMDAKDPQTVATELLPADTMSLPGQHEWNNIDYRDMVIGHDVSGLNPAAAQTEMQAANSQRWLWMGANGWRLDVAPDVSSGTWQKFREAVKSTKGLLDGNGDPIEDPVILGEEWGVATRFLLGDQFDSVMNYRFRNAIQSFMNSGNSAVLNEKLEAVREDYPKQAWQAMLNLVDSHDTTRSATIYDHPEWEEEHLKIAPDASPRALKLQELTAIFQMGYPGAPTIYYGDEVGLTGTKDPDSRRTFPWERVTEQGNGTYTGNGDYASILNVYQKAAKIRNENAVFRTGDLKVAYANDDVIVYARKNETKGALLVINRNSTAKTVHANVAGFLPEGLTLVDQLYGQVQGSVVDGSIDLTIPAQTGLMMVSTANLQVVPQVQGSAAVGGNHRVDLTWDAVVGAESYHIYRAAIEGGQVTLVGTTATTSWTDTAIVNGTKYYYAVTAVKGSGESFLSDMVSATPAFEIGYVGVPSSVTEAVYLQVGHNVGKIRTEIGVDGVTNDPANSGKEAPNLLASLVYYKQGTDPAYAQESKLRYESDSAGNKVYWASFEPTESGFYDYFVKASMDNGEHYTPSSIVSLQVFANVDDQTPPAAPALANITVESNRVALNWALSDDSVAGFEIYKKTVTEATYHKIATVAKSQMTYIDYAVSNDTAYTYRVAAYDAGYNRAFSEERAVMPKLVMVDVLLRLRLPDYTPSTDDIFIAGDFNGWNSSGNQLQVPSGATDRRVVEYSFKMMAGKTIQYKYTRGTWNTEAFTSHSRQENDTTDYGNWAYSSENTNMHLTISNQGDNKMVVEDNVLRWVDMPMSISMPRISFGDDIVYSTEDSTMKLKAVVPYGVNFTINGVPISAGSMDAFGHVDMGSIPLKTGLNTFVLHIEPSAATLNQPWYEDKGRKNQATKTVTISVTRTSEDPSTPDTPSNPTPTPANPPVGSQGVHDQLVSPADFKKNADGSLTVDVDSEHEGIRMPIAVINGAGAAPIIVQKENIAVTLPSDVLQRVQALVPAEFLQDAQVHMTVAPVSEAGNEKLLAHPGISLASTVFDFTLSVVTKDNKVYTLTKFDKPITLTFKLLPGADHKLTAAYYVRDDGTIEYVGGTILGDLLTVNVSHFSQYAALQLNKVYTDVSADHWAFSVIKELSAKHILEGMTDSLFAPENQVTRGQFAALLVRALGKEGVGEAQPFNDIEAGAWYESYVAAAYQLGIITGRDEHHFAPDEPITREEMAAMIVRAYQVMHDGSATAVAEGTPSFTDADSISKWALASVEQAVSLGLLHGREEHSFAPQGITTRAESAQVIYNLLQP